MGGYKIWIFLSGEEECPIVRMSKEEYPFGISFSVVWIFYGTTKLLGYFLKIF